MMSRSTLAVSVLVAALPLGRAAASFHLMQIEQVIGGVNGDTSAQAIQLRMRAALQNQVSQARLVVRDANGANPITIVNMASNVANSTAGSRVLIASAGFSAYTTPAAAPNFTMTNLIPPSYLNAGSLTFESDVGAIVYWRLSWGGASYTGTGSGDIANDSDGNFNPPFASALPSSSRQALQFTGASNALSTNNAAQYAITAGAALFINNAGTSYTVVNCTLPAQCDDSLFCNGAEVCTANNCAAGTDPCPGFSCDEVNNTCGACINDSDADADLGDGPDEGALGSLLVFPKVELRWDLAGNLLQDTFIRISNTSQTGTVRVQAFFVNGDSPLAAAPPERAHPGWNIVDSEFQVTQSQPVYWSTATGLPAGVIPFSALDPGFPPGRPDPDGNPNIRVLRGFIYAWAIAQFGQSSNNEISWNFLKGDAAILNYQEGSSWEYGAVAFQTVSAAQGTQPDGTPGQLLLDGVEYDSPFDTLLMDFIATGSAAMSSATRLVTSDGELILMPASADFRQDGVGPVTTKTTFTVYNANQLQFSSNQRCLTCWDQRLMSSFGAPNAFQRVVLGTDAARARIEGIAAGDCSDPIGGASQTVSLIGVQAHRSSFAAPNARTDRSGNTLAGRGAQSGVIRYDIIDSPEESNQDARTARRDELDSPDSSNEIAPLLANGNEDQSRLSRKGSLLIFPKVELKWDLAGAPVQDTIIELSNDDRCDPVRVRLVYVHGDPPLAAAPPERAHTGWNHLFDDVLLTNNQPIYWSATSGMPASVTAFTALDPGLPNGRPDPESASSRTLRGYLLAWAVDDNFDEIRWNHLTGRATIVNYSTGSAWDYNPRAFRARSGVQGGPTDATPDQLLLNGIEYDFPPNRLEFNFEAAGSTGLSGGGVTVNANTELLLMPVDNFLPAVGTLPTATSASFNIWNMNEVLLTGLSRCVVRWDQALATAYPPNNGFLLATLQTAAGRAQVDGIQSFSCAGSVAGPLVGVVAKRLTFTGGPGGSTAAGVTMAGSGEQAAAIIVNAMTCTAQSTCNDLDGCTCDVCTNGACQHVAIEFGNVNCSADQMTTVDDILCVLNGFANFAACPAADIAPTTGPFACQGNNAIDLDDILSVLVAFAGMDPCACQP